MALIFQIRQITIHPMPQKTERIKLLNDWKNVLLMFLHGSKITELKLTQKNATFLLVRKKHSTVATSSNLKININGFKIASCLKKKNY